MSEQEQNTQEAEVVEQEQNTAQEAEQAVDQNQDAVQ